MSVEQAKEILWKIQHGTATAEERKLAQKAFAIITKNIFNVPS